MRGKWFVISASAVLVVLVGIGVSLLLRARSEKTVAPAPVIQKAFEPVSDVNLQGKIRPQQVVGVAAPLEGMIGAFFAEVGQEVFEGQLLARVTNQGLETEQQSAQRDLENAQRRLTELDSQIITARLEASRAKADAIRSRAEYERLDKAYQRQQMLFNEGATPKLVYERASRDFDVAKDELRNREQLASNADLRVNEITRSLDAEKRSLEEKTNLLDSAKSRTGATEVLSPAQGMVVQRNGELGQPVSPEVGNLFEIATQLTLLEVVLDPDPPTLARLRPGQPALVVLPDQGGEGLSGSVKGIQGSQAIVAFNNPNPAIKPGMMAQVRIKVN